MFPQTNPNPKPDSEKDEMRDYSDSKYDEWAGINFFNFRVQ